MVSQIKNGRSEFVDRTSRKRSIHIVSLEGMRMMVVYDNKYHRIVTVLPKKALRLWDEKGELQTLAPRTT